MSTLVSTSKQALRNITRFGKELEGSATAMTMATGISVRRSSVATKA